jgi:hypothetical protein
LAFDQPSRFIRRQRPRLKAGVTSLSPCENPALFRTTTMDAERINLIGTQLADLSARTQALRGYL